MAPRLPAWSNPFPRGSWRLLEWLNPFDWLEVFGIELEGCLALGAIIGLIAAAVGAIFALTGLILQAETVLAEVLLDTVLVSALYHRLRSQPTEWWLGGALRRTVWPVVVTMLALTLAGALLQYSEPSAHSIGAVLRLWWNDRVR